MKIIAGLLGLSIIVALLAVGVRQLSDSGSRTSEHTLDSGSFGSISDDDLHAPTNGLVSPKPTPNLSRPPDSSAEMEDEKQRTVQALHEAFIDPESSAKFQSALQDALTDTHGAEEASFYLAFMNIGSWDEAERLISERSASTGQDYSQLRMQAALSMGTNNADEILTMAAAGTPVPNNAIYRLARRGEIDSIVMLAKSGYLQDISSVNPSTGRNALGELVSRISDLSHQYSPEEAAAAMRDLVSAGLEVNPRVEGATPLELALKGVSARNADVKLSMARSLLANGAIVTDSHRQLVNSISSDEQRQAFVELFSNQL